MVYRHARRLAARRKAARRSGLRMRKYVRKLRSKVHHSYTETFKSTPMIVNWDTVSTPLAAQEYTAGIDSLSQFASYKQLFLKYRITKLTWIIVPRFGVPEPNTAEANVGTGGTFQTNTIFHSCLDWTGINAPLPGSELSMLQRQGVKTRILGASSKPIYIVQKYPNTQRGLVVAGAGGTQLADNMKNIWCSFDDPEPAPHGSLLTFNVKDFTGNLGAIGQTCADVYCKVSFVVADPR